MDNLPILSFAVSDRQFNGTIENMKDLLDEEKIGTLTKFQPNSSINKWLQERYMKEEERDMIVSYVSRVPSEYK